jgi:peptidoglycan hydrolase CwlO-like protein
MKRNLFLILFILFSVQTALADNQSFGPIVQRQSKQIQELKSKLQELEKTVEDLKVDLKNNGFTPSSPRWHMICTTRALTTPLR